MLSCKPEVEMNFGHLEHGIFRANRYFLLKKQILESGKVKTIYSEE